MEEKNLEDDKKEIKEETKQNKGINFDNLSDWDNIVYPNDSKINQINLNNENNIINNKKRNKKF